MEMVGINFSEENHSFYSINSSVTVYLILYMVVSMIHYQYSHVFSFFGLISSGGSGIPILRCPFG